MGLIVLFLQAGILLFVALLASLVWRLLFPPRRGLGWALGRGLPGDPGELDADYAEVTFTLAGGSTTPGWVVRGGDEQGPVLVVSHGWGESRHVSLGRAAQLLRWARAMVCYDLRGHGESTSRRCDWSVGESADLLGIIEQLREVDSGSLKQRPMVLVGYSMGAAASLLAAARDEGERTSPVVAAVIAEGTGGNRIEPIAGVLRERRLPVQPLLTLARIVLQWTRLWPRELNMVPWMHKVACPVLLLHGRGDATCSLATARAVAEPIPDATLVVFESDAHLGLAEVDASRYLDAVRAFLDRVRAHTPASPETSSPTFAPTQQEPTTHV